MGGSAPVSGGGQDPRDVLTGVPARVGDAGDRPTTTGAPAQAGVDDVPTPRVGATLGFLFADLRGYTAFVEVSGAAAAASLLDRYRALVRGVVRATSGAEIRTEGDGFFVVFRSAGDAIRAGLAIVDRAAADRAEVPDAPIRVAVGIHAGETVETAEGYVGSAVNIAARVCAEAGPGEVLVSDTVRGLTRSVVAARFVSRGHRRLKGLEDSVELFAVYPGDLPLPAPVASQAAVESPYVGLRPFEEQDERFYVGREGDVEGLLSRLAGSRFLAVFGPSGSGKSSLVRAGLVPALRRGGVPGSESWQIEVLRPGPRPLDTLAARIVRLNPRATMASTVDELGADPRALGLAADVVLADAPPSARLVWVVDQAEELFTLCADESARRVAIAALVSAATVPGGRTVVVLAMRADFYHRCAAYPDLAALVSSSQHLATPLDATALRRAIEEPAAAVGLEFEPGLVETILADAADRPGALPLLEHALFELWTQRRGATLTLEGYRASGGIDGALAARAESTYGRLDPAEQAAARLVFLRLVQPGEGTDDTRRRATLAELPGAAGDEETTRHVTDALAAARLLTVGTGETTGEPVVDIAHEALIRAWPRLHGWVDEDREALRVARRVADAAAEWERLGRDRDALLRGPRLAEAAELAATRAPLLAEREQAFINASALERDRAAGTAERRRRLAISLSVGAATVFAVLGGVAWYGWTRSEAARRDADAARAQAESALSQADAARAQAEERRVEALGRELVAQSVANRDDLALSSLLAVEGFERLGPPAATDNLSTLLASHPEVVTIRSVPEPVVRIVASADGSRVAVLDDGPLLTVRDAASWSPVGEPILLGGLSWTGATAALAFTATGDRLAFQRGTGLEVVELASGAIQAVPDAADPTIMSAAWDGGVLRWVEYVGFAARVRSWDPALPTSSFVDLPAWTASPDVLARLLPGGRWVVVELWDRGVPVFSAATGGLRGTLPVDRVVGGSADGTYLVGETEGAAIDSGEATPATLQAYRLSDLAPVGAPVKVDGKPFAAVDSEGGRLYALFDSGALTVVDLATGSQVTRSGAASRPLAGVALAGRAGAFAARGTEIAVLDLERDERFEIEPDNGVESDLGWLSPEEYTLSQDGSTLAAWTPPQDLVPSTMSVRIEAVTSGAEIAELHPAWDAASVGMGLVADGGALLTLGADGRLLEMPVAGGPTRVLGTWAAGTWEPGAYRGWYLVAGRDSAVALFDGRILRADGTISPSLWGIGDSSADRNDFLPDGSAVVSAGALPERVILVDVASARVVTEIVTDGDPAGLDVSADGTRLLVGVVDPDDHAMLEVLSLPDGARLGTIPLAGVQARYGAGVEVRFEDAAGDRTAVTVTDRVRRWDVDPTSWQGKACELAGRNLTTDEWARYLGDEPYRATCPAFAAPAGASPAP